MPGHVELTPHQDELLLYLDTADVYEELLLAEYQLAYQGSPIEFQWRCW